MISCNETTNYVSSINLKLTNYLAGLISRASLKRPDGTNAGNESRLKVYVHTAINTCARTA